MGRRLDSHALFRTDSRVFYKNALPNEMPALCVGLLLDESGSMSWNDRATYARSTAIILYDFCQALGIPITVYGHSTSDRVDLYSYAEFEEMCIRDRLNALCRKFWSLEAEETEDSSIDKPKMPDLL